MKIKASNGNVLDTETCAVTGPQEAVEAEYWDDIVLLRDAVHDAIEAASAPDDTWADVTILPRYPTEAGLPGPEVPKWAKKLLFWGDAVAGYSYRYEPQTRDYPGFRGFEVEWYGLYIAVIDDDGDIAVQWYNYDWTPLHDNEVDQWEVIQCPDNH